MIKKSVLILFLVMSVFVSVCVPSHTLANSTFTDALALVEKENYLQAAQRLESLLQIPSGKLSAEKQEIHHVLAYCYERQKKWAEAIEHYQKAVSQNYDLADYGLYHLAKSYQQMEDYPNAVIWYQRLVNRHPQSFHIAEAKYEIAHIYREQGEYAKALEVFSPLITNSQSGYVRRAMYESAKAYEGLQSWEEAQLTYQQLIDANAGNQTAKEALAQLQRLIKRHPALQITRSQRMMHGMVLYNHRQLREARPQFREVARGHKDMLTGRATYYIGRSYYGQRKYDLAIKEYNKIVSLYPASGYLTRALYQTTLCYRRKGQPELAQKHLKAFIANYSWSALADNALYDLGWVQENQEQYDEAIASYRRLTRKYRRSDMAPQAYWRIGWIQFKNKRYAACIDTFALFMELFPEDSFAMAAHFWTAKSYERQDQRKTAGKIYSQIVEANHWYYSNRAKEQLKRHTVQKQAGKTLTALVHSRARVISDGLIWKGVGLKKTPRIEKLMHLKLFEDAVTEIKGTIQSDRSNLRDSYYNLIVCYQKLKKFQQAHEYADKLSKFQSLRDENQAIPLELYQLLYPVYYTDMVGKHAKKYKIDPLFVASMIREESRYNAEIVSSAGALGLMQIMPATGRELARRLKIRRFHRGMLFDPDINIQMGTWYMKDLMDRFENNHALVAGAYNGGPGRMQRWLSEMDTSDLDEFIEDISITQTRRHIKKVIDSYYIYQELYPKPESDSTEES